ncbi:ribulose-phosphate 3-epimerase [Bacillus sp. FJAT-42376]|uniref:ribulose-phosphate 3-epimerase n=1 Tax=Bacillus sp. FJAT-42376 TaxID=2014076 RepID=UPI000F4E9F2B|nr:ribulose-phosphate 3-epimerase [Bacillus sp. FJAT-42376]AZB42894.1 ribulose-phosphate 3-epimerase [Bacillus sp. FJAT-42376]
MVTIAPSILSADFSRLKEEIEDVERAGADWIHIDVMDGHFVPNITIGPLIVKAVRPVTKLPLDVHLMIDNPDTYIDEFAEAGADLISVHAEACTHLHRTIQHIKSKGVKAGAVLNPHTPLSVLDYVLPHLDYVLLMTVNPGFGGQSFIPEMLGKISELSAKIKEAGLSTLIQIDGGVSEKNAAECVHAGAQVLVAGSAIYGKPDREKAIKEIRDAV